MSIGFKCRANLKMIGPYRRSILVATGLFLCMACTHPAPANDPKIEPVRMFRFSAKCQTSMGPGYIEGLMASNQVTSRIAIFWMEPAILRDRVMPFFSFSDFILTNEMVWYWIDGMSEYRTLSFLSSLGPLISKEKSLESVVQSSLAILGHMNPLEQPSPNNSLEVGRFFREARAQTDHTLEVLGDEKDSISQIEGAVASDLQTLNQLPFGRKYVKAEQSDGSHLWYVNPTVA
jgi:hypothetical protein